MRKEGSENLTLTWYVESKRNRGKPCTTYQTSLCNWMEEQGSGKIAKRHNLLKATKEEEIVESHDHQPF